MTYPLMRYEWSLLIKRKRKMKTREKTLEQWLDGYYDDYYNILNLSYYNFFWCESDCFGVTCYENASYKHYIPLFMRDPNTYLDANPHIKGLSLFSMGGTWAPEFDMQHLADNTTLTYLNLGDNELRPDDIKVLAENKKIRQLRVAYNYIGDGAAYFANNQTIESLTIPYNGVRGTGAMGIAKMSALKELDISYNTIGDEAGAAIVNNCKNLTRVNLSHTGIGKETVKAILANTTLTDVDVSSSDVGCCDKFKIWRATKHNAKRLGHYTSSSAFFPAGMKEKPVSKENVQSGIVLGMN